MKKTTKRFLAVLLTLVMIVSLLPSSALAQEENEIIDDKAFSDGSALPEDAGPEETEAQAIADVTEGVNYTADYETEEITAGDGFGLAAREEYTAYGTCGDSLTWTLDSNGILTVSGTGEMYDYQFNGMYTDAPWYEHYSDIKELVVSEGVTSVGEYAFYSCAALESASIPASVIYIASTAFVACSGLKNITVSQDSASYSASDSVLYNRDQTAVIACLGGVSGKFTVPDSVIEIGDFAFFQCYALTEVVIPDTVERIGMAAFGDSSLKEIVLPRGLETVEDYSFINCVALKSLTVQDGVTSIGQGAFWNCINLSDIYYTDTEDKWEGIEIKAENDPLEGASMHFAQVVSGKCGKALTWTLNYYGTLTVSGTGDMYDYEYNGVDTDAPWYDYYSDINELVISEGVTSVGEYMLYYCDTLERVSISASVTDIASTAFVGCSALNGFEVAEDNEDYSSSEGVLYNKAQTVLVSCPGSVSGTFVIPDGVEEIGLYGFFECLELTDVDIPDTVETICQMAFGNCTGLTSLVLPNGLKSIDMFAFISCDGLESVTIQNGITTIGAAAFFMCDSLTDVYFNGTEAQWSNISVDESNVCIINAKKHFAGFAVSFDSCGGSEVEPISVAYGGKYPKLPVPRKEGAVFAGWYNKAELIVEGNTVTLTAEATLKALWQTAIDNGDVTLSLTNSEVNDAGAAKAAVSLGRNGTSGQAEVTVEPIAGAEKYNFFVTYTDLTGKTVVLKKADGVYPIAEAEDGGAVRVVAVLRGDCNCDERVDPKDITLLSRRMAGITGLSSVQEAAVDCDKDGKTTVKDLTKLARALARIEDL